MASRDWCCVECFQDEVVRAYVSQHGTRSGTCPFCRTKKARLASTKVVGPFVAAGIMRAYDPVDLCGEPSHPSQMLASYRSADSLLYGHDLFSPKVGESATLTRSLLAPAWPRRPDDDDGIDLTDSAFVSKSDWEDEDHNSYSSAWSHFKWMIMHRRRFFDPPEQTIMAEGRADILNPVASLFPLMDRRLPAGTRLWRVRPDVSELPADPKKAQKALGPPPQEIAKNSRMNPPGIPYMYLALDMATCVAEVRPDVGDRVLLGCFELTTPLRVLDLTEIPAARRMSIFDPTYQPGWAWASDFLKEFTAEISQPVKAEESHLEYVPTQVLAEFIRDQGYDGLKFRSSLNSQGYNVVVFKGPTPSMHSEKEMRDVFVLWMRLVEAHVIDVNAIQYSFTPSRKVEYSAEETRVVLEDPPF